MIYFPEDVIYDMIKRDKTHAVLLLSNRSAKEYKALEKPQTTFFNLFLPSNVLFRDNVDDDNDESWLFQVCRIQFIKF